MTRCTIDGLNCGDLGRPVRHGEVGKLPFSDMFTPGELKADIATLTRRVREFGEDQSAAPSEDEKILAFRREFATWHNEYFDWFKSIDGPVGYTLNSTRDKARAYADELQRRIDEWKSLGGKVSPAVDKPPSKDIGGPGRGPKGGGLGLGSGLFLVGVFAAGVYIARK